MRGASSNPRDGTLNDPLRDPRQRRHGKRTGNEVQGVWRVCGPFWQIWGFPAISGGSAVRPRLAEVVVEAAGWAEAAAGAERQDPDDQ